MIFESIKDIMQWDLYVSKTGPVEILNENAYILRLVYSDLNEGIAHSLHFKMFI